MWSFILDDVEYMLCFRWNKTKQNMDMGNDSGADREAGAVVSCYERGQRQQGFLISPISKRDQPPQLI